jgi:hypothetical protein
MVQGVWFKGSEYLNQRIAWVQGFRVLEPKDHGFKVFKGSEYLNQRIVITTSFPRKRGSSYAVDRLTQILDSILCFVNGASMHHSSRVRGNDGKAITKAG